MTVGGRQWQDSGRRQLGDARSEHERSPRLGGRLLTPVLLAVGAALTALALLAGWAQWQLVDSQAWGDTSQRLLERSEVRDRVSQYVVAEVRKSSGGALTPELGDRLDREVSRQLATPRSERVWRRVTADAHRQLVDLIHNDATGRGDVVVLDLRPLIRSAARDLAVPLPAVPAGVGRVTIVAGDQVRGAREAADRLERTATVLLIAAPLVLLLAIGLARGWRVRALAGAGISIAVGGGLVLVARGLVGAHVVDVLTPSGAGRDAVAAAWSVGTSSLSSLAVGAIVAGLVIAAGASIAARPRARHL